MEKKKCTKCNEEKELSEFYFMKYKNRHNPRCRNCVSIVRAKYRKDNKEKISKYNSSNVARVSRSRYKKRNKEAIIKQNKEYVSREEVRVRIRKNNKILRDNNPEKFKKIYKKRDLKIKNDPLLSMKHRLRSRTRWAFKMKNFKKGIKTKETLGCDFKTVFNHIESQFTEGMTWENRSEWHIDHIIPLSSAKTKEELIKLCHYTNLQPLWADDNLRKGDKLNYKIPKTPEG